MAGRYTHWVYYCYPLPCQERIKQLNEVEEVQSSPSRPSMQPAEPEPVKQLYVRWGVLVGGSLYTWGNPKQLWFQHVYDVYSLQHIHVSTKFWFCNTVSSFTSMSMCLGQDNRKYTLPVQGLTGLWCQQRRWLSRYRSVFLTWRHPPHSQQWRWWVVAGSTGWKPCWWWSPGADSK